MPFLALATLAAGAAATLILLRHPVPAGVAVAVGGAALVLGAGRSLVSGSNRAGFAERLIDRLIDACALAPVAWVARQEEPRIAVLALVGLAVSYLAAYELSRGTGLGYRGREGLGYRATRFAFLAVGLLSGFLEAALWAFVAVATAASAVRAANVAAQERRAGPAVPGRQ